MNFEVNDMKVLGAIEGGGRTIKNIKDTSRLEKKDVERILEFLVKSKLVEDVEGKGIWGQTQYYFNTTDTGSKIVEEYIDNLKDEWKKIIQFVTDGQRQELDEYVKQNKFLVNMMLYFKIVNLPALGRLNLRFLIEGKHLCYKCKKDLGRFALKFSVSDCRKRGLKMPKGLTTHDDLCADCFDGLAVR
jgi:predicted transcriptional regulator